ncbi:MAG: late competence development ComFB family protein [Clostridium sp.]|uniref:late competence development ComFB family protein n=1 Tax=Clostridium sp. TaxID=1506 RepID=UPI0025BD5E11|nr:late competence development ComFB family protein [Clostridium sp.]MCE5221278.1 late competence development ComFB family protein [Clostridium sp.]
MNDVINYVEVWVQEYMDILLEKVDGCKCEKCKRDIFALALNNLKPHYVATPLGEIMAKLESTKQQVETDIIVEVTKAINKINSNPNHDR